MSIRSGICAALCCLLLAGCDTPRNDGKGNLYRFAPVGFHRANQPDFGIFYYPQFREIHIYGNEDQPNVARARIVNTGSPNLSSNIVVEVELLGIDPSVNQPVSLTRRYQLFSEQFQGNPAPTDPGGTIATEAGGSNPPGRLVHEIWFHGGDQNDEFENGTDVPSYMNGRDGPDRLTGGTSRDKLLGGRDDDVILGSAGPDLIEGDYGSDFLRGGAGNDRLVEKATGNDNDVNTMCGGSGADDLDGTPLAQNLMDDGDGAEFADILRDGSEYVYTGPPDTVIENGTEYTSSDDPGAPFSVDDVGC